MLKKVTMILALIAIFAGASMAQWVNQGAWPSEDVKGSTHGLAVDPDGKVWVSNFFSDGTIVDVNSGDTVLVHTIKVFHPDGTPADFSPIKVADFGGSADTLYGSTRGMRTDADGNILYVSSGPEVMMEFDYQTGDALQKVELDITPTAPTVAENGNIFVGPVIPGNPVKEYGNDFTFLGNAIEETVGYARSFAVSGDATTIYWAGYSIGKIYVYNRPDEFSNFALEDSILTGFYTESVDWHPSTGNLWLSAGPADDFASEYSNYTWYAYDTENSTIVDSLKWSFVAGIDSSFQRPRALDFSPDGNTAYISTYSTNDLPMMQKVVRGEGASVTFECNMKGQVILDNFDPASDTVEVRGSFNEWSAGSMMTDPDGDTTYTYTYDGAMTGDTLEFKFWHSPDVWEGVDNRILPVTGGNVTYSDFFNSDTLLTEPKDLEVTYRANMEIERLSGRFDPATDTVELRGEAFGWGPGVVMEQSALNQDIYIHTATQNLSAGQKLPGYKFWYTGENWEGGSNRTLNITMEMWNAGEITIERFFNDASFEDVTGQEATILLTVDTEGAVSAVSGNAFDEVATVHAFGATQPLSWPTGGWPDEDIDAGVQLYDDGSNGDETADDQIFSAEITFAPYTPFEIQYKYGINYSLENNGGGNDNEAGVGDDHFFYLQKDLVYGKVENVFGEMGTHELVNIETGVKEMDGQTPDEYKLTQNYPNPFNPTTNIRFSIPESGIVTMKIYNTLGEQVATLINEQKAQGEYNVSFNASNLPSGVYIYQIRVNDFTASKKMMLMK